MPGGILTFGVVICGGVGGGGLLEELPYPARGIVLPLPLPLPALLGKGLAPPGLLGGVGADMACMLEKGMCPDYLCLCYMMRKV